MTEKSAITVLIGRGRAVVNTVAKDDDPYDPKSGLYEVRRLSDPTDAVAALLGPICIGHQYGVDGIAFSPQEARSLAAMLEQAADECDKLTAEKKADAS